MGHKKTIFNLDVFNRWLTLLTNLGVIIGLVFVFYEVQQNTLALENGADIAVWEISSQNTSILVESSEVAQLFTRFETEPWDTFTKVEQTRLTVLLGLSIDRLELQLRLFERKGDVLDRDNIIFPEFLVKLNTFKDWWQIKKQTSASYPAHFVKFFDAYIKEVNGGK